MTLPNSMKYLIGYLKHKVSPRLIIRLEITISITIPIYYLCQAAGTDFQNL